MKASDLDRRVTFQRPETTDDGFSKVDVWLDLVATRAKVTPVSDGERWRAGEVGASVTHRFQVRWLNALADLNPKDRLIYEGRVFNISGVKEMGRRDGLEVTASARAD